MTDKDQVDILGELNDEIIRTVKDGKYFSASNESFQDNRLSWETRGMIGYLLSKPNHWQTRFRDLLNQGPAKDYKLKRMLAEARMYGYMARFRVREEAGTFKWITLVYESPSLNPHIKKSKTGIISVTSTRKSRSGASARKSTTGTSARLSTRGKSRHIVKTEVVNTDPNEEEGVTLSVELEKALEDLGVFRPIWKEISRLLAHPDWAEADIVALMDWSKTAPIFVTRMRGGTRAPSKFYSFEGRKMSGAWYPGQPVRDTGEDWDTGEDLPEGTGDDWDTGDPVLNGYWRRVLDQLQPEFKSVSFDLYMLPSRPLSLSDGVLTINARSNGAREWMDDRVRSSAERLLVGITGAPVKVAFIVDTSPAEE